MDKFLNNSLSVQDFLDFDVIFMYIEANATDFNVDVNTA